MEQTKKNAFQVGNYLMKLIPIGEGSFGKVFHATNLKTSQIFAAKRLDYQKVSENPKKLEHFIGEVKLANKINHDNIIRLHDIVRSKNNIYIILEFCDGETLHSFLANYIHIFNHPPSIQLIQFFSRQIVSGLSYMASNNYIHRDVKLDNIMLSVFNFDYAVMKKQYEKDITINKEGLRNMSIAETLPVYNIYQQIKKDVPFYYSAELLQSESIFEKALMSTKIKIIDLGFARELDSQGLATSLCGSPVYMAPEIWDIKVKYIVKAYSNKVDLWSFGCTIFQLTTGHPPFLGKNHEELYEQIEIGDYFFESADNLSYELMDLINGLIQTNPDDRFSWNEVAVHPFIIKPESELTPLDLPIKTKLLVENKLKMNAKVREKFIIPQVIFSDSNDDAFSDEKKIIKQEEEPVPGLSPDDIEKIFFDDNCIMIEFFVHSEEDENGWTIIDISNEK